MYDLNGKSLPAKQAPSLLINSSHESHVLDNNAKCKYKSRYERYLHVTISWLSSAIKNDVHLCE